VVLAALLVAGRGCSGKSSSEGPKGDGLLTEQVAFPVGSIASNLVVAAGQTQYFGFTLSLPPDEGIQSWKIDLLASLARAQVTLLPSPFRALLQALASGVTLDLGVSHALPAGTVCDASVEYRTFTFNLSPAYLPVSVDPPAAISSAQTIAARANGPFTYCVRITFPVDALITVDQLVADVTRKCTQAPGNFAGPWTGSWGCHSVTCSTWTDSGPIALNVSYDAVTRRWSHVDDTGASYQGSACGNAFHFVRNDPDESERGTMTLNSDGTATKTSRFFSTAQPGCYGDCTDFLHRQ
jgi:hypothetical protein